MKYLYKKYHLFYLTGFFIILALPILNAMPFFGLPAWLSPPDWGKVIFFRIIISAILCLFTWQMIFDKLFASQIILKLRSAFTYVSGLAGLFLVFLLSVIFSTDPFFSFFGDPGRAGGFLNFGFYIIFSILMFLIIEKKYWQKIWDFTISIGTLVSLVAISQHYNILNIFIAQARPGSTIGSSVLLGIYLLFLVFMSFTFFLKEKDKKRKIAYFSAFLLFLFVIALSQSRATFLGLSVGFAYFSLLFSTKIFSKKEQKIIIFSKIAFLIFAITAVFFIYYVNVSKEIPFLNGNNFIQKTVKGVLPRLSLSLVTADPRFSVWNVAFGAIKEKPLLGWGPGNFSVAFDKYYDPSLPYITTDWGSWYDKAHNFIFDIAVENGILGLTAYLLILGLLFYKIQNLKNKNPENYIIYHGIQATFIGYLVNNLFCFDSFSNYIILFLLIAFSLKLISNFELKENTEKEQPASLEPSQRNKKYKTLGAILLFLAFLWFAFAYNLKPFFINAQMNFASQNKNCQKSLPEMEKLLSSGTYLNHYIGIKYANLTNACLAIMPASQNLDMVKKAIMALKDNTKIRPTFTRDWLYLGRYTNFLLESSKDKTDSANLKNEADYYFKKALELSSKRQEIFASWLKTYFVIKDYKKSEEISAQCVSQSASMGECWWYEGLSNVYLNNLDKAKENFKKAGENDYNTDDPLALYQLSQIYLELKNYNELVAIHQKLVNSDPKNIQYLATLAYNYKIVGDYKMARETCQKILEIDKSAEVKQMVDEFLQTLP